MLLNYFINLLLVQETGVWECALFGYIVCIVRNLRRAEAIDSTKHTALYQILFVLLAGFGGGILNPILLGYDKFFPFPMGSDVVVPLVFLAWLLVMHSPKDAFAKLLESRVGSLIFDLLLHLVRARLICAWAEKSHQVVSASYFDAGPVFGPLITGFLGGCGGQFCVKGIGCVRESLPLVVESALAASLVHLSLYYRVTGLGYLTMSAAEMQLAVVAVLLALHFIPATRHALPWRWGR